MGNKVNNLRKLRNMRFKIPSAYCCTWDSYDLFQERGERVLQQLREEISEIIDHEKPYAVRSLTDLEDCQDYTYAGQFTTILDVRGLNTVLQGTQEVWKSS